MTTKQFWEDRWESGRTGWDSGRASTNLKALVALARDEGALAPGAKVLEPGCGRAHNGAALAGLGYHVTSCDVVPGAIAKARELYGDVPNLTLAVHDALTPEPAWAGQFDAVVDRAVLCALPRELRRRYVDVCFGHLKPGGFFLSLPFTALRIPESEGPPFQVTMHQLSELLQPGFTLLAAEEQRPFAPDDKVAQETATVWRRRPKMLVERA